MDKASNPSKPRTSLSYSHNSVSLSKSNSTHSSPFNRITSDKNLKQSQLPSFLRSSVSLTSQSKPSLLPNFKNQSAMIDYIKSCENPLNCLVKVSKAELKQDDLRSLLSGAVAKSIIDSLLTIFKHLNSKATKQRADLKKVLIAKTNFTQKVFNNEKNDAVVDISDNSLLIFPIFVGHWTVLVANCNEMVVNYYDPLKRYLYLKEILRTLYRFLRKQLKYDGKNLIQSQLKELVYQRVTISSEFEADDSALYILRLIYNISTGEKQEVTSTDLQQNRMLFLRLLFQYGDL